MLIETSKKRVLLFVLTLFSLFCLLVPRDLQAADQGYGSFWYGPKETTVEGVKYLKTGVVASNKYDAALYALGFGKSTVNGISNTKKNKLIANSTFSNFANKFKTGKPDDDAFAVIPGIPTIGIYPDSMLTTWYGAAPVYGESSCYWSVYSKDAADSAEDAAYKIIKGGSSSGGGGGGEGSSSGGTIGQDTNYVFIETEQNEWPNRPDNPYSGVAIELSLYQRYLDFFSANEGFGLWIAQGGYGDNNKTNYYSIVCLSVKPVFTMVNDEYWKEYTWPKRRTAGFMQKTSSAVTYNDKQYLVITGTPDFTIYDRTNSGITDACRPVYSYYWSGIDGSPEGGGGNEPTEPPKDWPVEPPTPTPPTPPDPTVPTPPTPWNPIPDIDIDITGDDFQDLLDALNEHCIHLQNSISSNISQLWSLQSDLISDHMSTFWDNLHNDLLWLGECLNFDVNVNVDGGSGGDGGSEGGGEGDTNTYVPFDDTSIIYWLKQIWSKLGNGISIKPVDPVVNPDGWWDWFANLLGGLIGALADIGLDKIGGLVDALDTLKDKFPFCIPWDIAALLGLLVSEPVTPVIDLPLMALSVSNGVQEVGTMTIDLTAYNDAWEAVRWIERIAFCVYLAGRTKDFLDLLGKVKG